MKTKSRETTWKVSPVSHDAAMKENLKVGFKGHFKSHNFKSVTPKTVYPQ